MKDDLFRLRIETAPHLSAIVETGLILLGWFPAIWTHDEDGYAWIDIYLDVEDPARDLHKQLSNLLPEWLPHDPYKLTMVPVPSRDWAEAWKEGYHLQRVSRRIVIKPSWESYEEQPDDCVIELDPGMSFGTGQHATTRACLTFLDQISSEPDTGSFLDIGCGSGILSIAAAKLGFSPISAIDYDPVAIAVSVDNLEKNGVRQRISCTQDDLGSFHSTKIFHAVAANLLAQPLLNHADLIATVTEKHLLISGLLTNQYEEVRTRYDDLGFREVNCLREGEWASGHLVKQA